MPQILLLLLFLLLAACSDDSRTEREVGIINYYGESREVLVAPDTVQAGEAFTVTVRTYGDGCVDTGDMEVETTGELAVLTPYDLREITNEPCPQILKRLEHTVQLVFEEPGAVTIRVEGREESDANPEGVRMTLEETIQVE